MIFQIKYTMRARNARNVPVEGYQTSEQQLDTTGPIFTGYIQMLKAKHPLPKNNLLSPLDEQVRESYELFYNEAVNPNGDLVRHVLEVSKIG